MKGKINMSDRIMVSVICTVYNHAMYLRKCLDGFVMQKTNFKFEVLIHDDASTDGSQDIIREYEEKYPDIIKPIYQTENQYSKGVKISQTFLYPKIKSKYVAICEGDDCWIDNYKLQKQYDIMEKYNCGICVHQATRFDVCSKEKKLYTDPNIEEGFYPLEKIIEKGSMFSTCSFFVNFEILRTMPESIKSVQFGDHQMLIWCAYNGGCYYLPKNMGIYNWGVSGSWTDRVWKNRKKRIAHCKEMIRVMKEIDVNTEMFFHDSVEKKIAKTEYNLYKSEGNIFKLFNRKYAQYYNQEKQSGYSPLKECLSNLLLRVRDGK